MSEDPGTPVGHSAYLAAYAEICKSYHAIDDFRMKLLGLLPLASLVGILLIDNTDVLGSAGTANELLGFAAVFASMLTLALFGYEVRGIQRCHNLIIEGKHLEAALGVQHGQFHICEEEHRGAPLRALNAKFIACVIYSLVFASWLFLALRYGFGWKTGACAVSATAAGIAIAAVTYLLIRKLTPP